VREPKQQGIAADAGLERGGLGEQIVFGTRDPSEIDAIVDRFCRTEEG